MLTRLLRIFAYVEANLVASVHCLSQHRFLIFRIHEKHTTDNVRAGLYLIFVAPVLMLLMVPIWVGLRQTKDHSNPRVESCVAVYGLLLGIFFVSLLFFGLYHEIRNIINLSST